MQKWPVVTEKHIKWSQESIGDFHISAPFCRTVAYQNNSFHRCVSCWSNLPPTVTSATSLKQFINALARVDLKNYLQYRF